jgi:Mg-chelatase subunit ChlD
MLTRGWWWAMWVFVAVAWAAASQAAWSLPIRAEYPQQPSEADLVFVTEDFADWPPDLKHFGCDSISVLRPDVAELPQQGIQQVSPGRLTVSPALTVAIATHANQNRFLYVLSREDATGTRWTTGKILGARPAWQGGTDFLPDNRTFLVATQSDKELDDFVTILVDRPPYFVREFELPASLAGQRPIGPPVASVRTDAAAVEILVSPDGQLAHVLLDDDTVHTYDVAGLEEVASPIRVAPVIEPKRWYQGYRGGMHAVLSADGRYVVTNRWDHTEINVADLIQRRSWVLATSADLGVTGGVAINRGWINTGLLAVHALDYVVVYQFAPAGSLVELSRQAIARPLAQLTRPQNGLVGPLLSVAWSATGQYLIAAASNGSAEFAVIEVSDGGRHLSAPRYVTVCEKNMNFPNDIWTPNGLLTPPVTPTATQAATATATSTARATPSRSASPTPTSTNAPPTATATDTATPTLMPSPTAAPLPLYVPIVVREHCDPVHERSDIALVIDSSSSMTGQKIEDAQEAALAFVRLIDLAPGRSQVAFVRFDREAEVVRELSSARALIEAVIRNVSVRSGTHIDKGLRTALGELQSPRHLKRNAQVLILLTDGVQTGTPGEELRAAAEVHAAGVMVYTIGLGADVDAATLRTIAGVDDRYYLAPDSGDLARIYGEIARDLTCPGVELWGGQ